MQMNIKRKASARQPTAAMCVCIRGDSVQITDIFHRHYGL